MVFTARCSRPGQAAQTEPSSAQRCPNPPQAAGERRAVCGALAAGGEPQQPCGGQSRARCKERCLANAISGHQSGERQRGVCTGAAEARTKCPCCTSPGRALFSALHCGCGQGAAHPTSLFRPNQAATPPRRLEQPPSAARPRGAAAGCEPSRSRFPRAHRRQHPGRSAASPRREANLGAHGAAPRTERPAVPSPPPSRKGQEG